jgi:predicted alpha/beta hydrolase
MGADGGDPRRKERGARRRSRARTWEVRSEVAAPRASFEELEIHAADGAVLRAVVDDPPAGTELRATLVLAHAMFARKSSFGRRDRPGLSSALTTIGFRTVAFDFRGHGDSSMPKTSRDWGYDDLVRFDLPAVVDCARARGDEKPVIVVGHSLGGHVALAACGTRRIDVDAIVAVGANVWLRSLEPSRVRWAAKVAIARGMLAFAARAGGIPARRLRLGSDDADARYVRDLFRSITHDAWTSSDGKDDYLGGLADVRVPVAAVLGDRDPVMCHPAAGEAFARRCAGPVSCFHAPVGHMELVTSDRARSAVLEAVEWATSEVTRARRPGSPLR